MSGKVLENIIICDIDGTIADCEHRRHYITTKPKNYDAFYEEVMDDAPINRVLGLLNVLMDYEGREFQLVFVTGRPERCRADTVEWLRYQHFYPSDYTLFMRKDGDHRQDYIVKQEILDTHINKSEVWLVLDDRKQVVDMWRRNGLTCLQVAEGNF
jgi:phosphoglycolate phosphatase-like HAD superfamily hydrolase